MKPYLERLFKSNVALADHTTFRIGGPARLFCAARSEESVLFAVDYACRSGIPWIVIGAGSNLLVGDQAIDRAVIAYRNDQPPRLEDDAVIVSGGAPLGLLVEFCIDHGIAGFESLAGIPGTVGGAVAGNAGAYGVRATDLLHTARVLTRAQTVVTMEPAHMGLCYRTSALKQEGAVVLEARFRRTPGNSDTLRTAAERRRRDRQAKHPDYRRHPTAGSFFKNLPPAPGTTRRLPAGKLLEDVGAKHMRVGGAAPWPHHANILVNWGDATARDVSTLADDLAARVKDRFGVVLEREVTTLG